MTATEIQNWEDRMLDRLDGEEFVGLTDAQMDEIAARPKMPVVEVESGPWEP